MIFAFDVLRLMLLLGSLAGLGFAVHQAVGMSTSTRPMAPTLGGTASVVGKSEPLSKPSIGIAVAPFRGDRRPSHVRFGTNTVLGAESRAARPVLGLRGILWGARPLAILEGLPGTEGQMVVSAGDTVGALVVRRIAPTRVVISGMDTVWVLGIADSSEGRGRE